MVSHINAVKPDILVSHAVHGVSGFNNHLVMQAIEKEFCKMKREGGENPKRLALFSRMGEVDREGKFRFEASDDDEVI